MKEARAEYKDITQNLKILTQKLSISPMQATLPQKTKVQKLEQSVLRIKNELKIPEELSKEFIETVKREESINQMTVVDEIKLDKKFNIEQVEQEAPLNVVIEEGGDYKSCIHELQQELISSESLNQNQKEPNQKVTPNIFREKSTKE